ncbi:MAG: HipA N-terminal domain-containing protein [Bacteroidota bacterium]
MPEGWLLKISTEVFHVNPQDRLSLLLAVGEDTVGAVSVIPE